MNKEHHEQSSWTRADDTSVTLVDHFVLQNMYQTQHAFPPSQTGRWGSQSPSTSITPDFIKSSSTARRSLILSFLLDSLFPKGVDVGLEDGGDHAPLAVELPALPEAAFVTF